MLVHEWDNPRMSNNKDKKPSFRAVLAGLKQEMAEPRVAGSAQAEVDRQRVPTIKAAGKT
jgi:hypothetical protein